MTLVVIPTFLRSEKEADVSIKTIETLRRHDTDVDILAVDDCSPDGPSLDKLVSRAGELEAEVIRKPENEGFSRTVNVGMRRALESGDDVVLCNADVEFIMPVSELMSKTLDSEGRPAAVVGALLLYPNGMIQHAGVFVSFLSRSFDHRFRFAPGGLPEAHVPHVCPVTGALQFIRHGTLEEVGLYDENFRMGFEDVDYCIRVFESGLECVYNPVVRAIHHESLFRGQSSETLDEWHQTSIEMLYEKHSDTPLGRYVPPIV